jgi:multidrug resistance efflux pump
MRIVLVVTALASVAALVSFGRSFQDASPVTPGASAGVGSSPAPGTVGSRPIFRGSDRITADGVVEGAQPESLLRTEIAGTLAAVYVKEGQTVKRGDLLAELRNETQKIEIALATAELAQARARLSKVRNGERVERRKALAAIEDAKLAAYRQAKGALERTQRLWDQHSISRDEYDRDFFAAERAKAEVAEAAAEHAMVEAPARPDEVSEHEALVLAAQAKLQLAQTELAKTRMLAPNPGRVLRVFAEPGEVAGPATEQPVLLLADLSRLRVRAFVEELDANRLRVGQDATITADGLPGKHLAGKVTQVAPRMGRRSPQTDAPGEYKDLYFREVLIEPEGADGLPLNFRVLARIRVDPESRTQ